MSKGYLVLYILFLASLIAPTIGIPLTLLIFIIVILGIIVLCNSSENINEDEKKDTDNKNIQKRVNDVPAIQTEKKVVEKSKITMAGQNAPPVRKMQSQEQQNLKKTTTEKLPIQTNEQEPKKSEVLEKKEDSDNNQVQKALSLYDDFAEIERSVINIDKTIAKTQKDEIVWYEGSNNKVTAWAADYQNGLLALYKDLEKKKYKLLFFEGKQGFVQKLTKITELRKAIEVQIDNRKVKKDIIPSTGFLVRTNMFRCIRNHNVEDIIAVFKVLNSQGRIIQVEAPAAKCEKCKVFYIHEYIFQKILTYGTPLCQVISEKQYLNGSYLSMNPGMAQKSLLKICGYSVNATEGLTDQERQRILESIVGNGIMTRHEIIQYLNYFISMRKNQSRDMSEAISKWKRDVYFVENMRPYGLSRYEVKTVYKIEK